MNTSYINIIVIKLNLKTFFFKLIIIFFYGHKFSIFKMKRII